MSGTYLASGIVLSHRDIRDFDRVVTIFTDRYGKLDAVARGVRKITSKLAGHLEPLSYSSFMFAVGRSFDVLASSVKLSSFRLPHSDLFGFALANYFFECVNRLTRPKQPDQRVFRLCVAYLQELEQERTAMDAPSFQRLLATEYFLWQLLDAVGFAPSLDHCVVCRKSVGQNISVRKGGVLCDEHAGSDEHAMETDQETLDILRLMADRRFEPLTMIARSRPTVERVDQSIARFIEHHIEQPIVSRELLSHFTAFSP